MLLNFCLWVEGEIEELEEAGPLSAQHKKIKKLVKEHAAHELISMSVTSSFLPKCHCNFSMGGPDTWAIESVLELIDAPAEPPHQSETLSWPSPSSLNS